MEESKPEANVVGLQEELRRVIGKSIELEGKLQVQLATEDEL